MASLQRIEWSKKIGFDVCAFCYEHFKRGDQYCIVGSSARIVVGETVHPQCAHDMGFEVDPLSLESLVQQKLWEEDHPAHQLDLFEAVA